MDTLKIVKVSGRKQLKAFITFPEKLYKDCENWVPALYSDEFATLDKKKNAAFEFCDADYFLAYRGPEIVGRVAAIINRKANELWNQNAVRFGWLDFIEDEAVLRALMDEVAAWGKERGCTEIKGPWGFTDMDKEGLLVEGYENLSPFTCLYNFPYYDELLKKIGFTKDVDWTQRICYIDKEFPPMFQFADMIEKRYGIHAAHPKSMKDLADRYGMDLFHMYNETFAPLFQFTPLTDRQIKAYLASYVPILDKDFVCLIVDGNDKPVAFAICVPTISKAIKKCNGRLFPFGVFNILHALRHNDTLEALMIGVLPEYQGKGASVLLFKYLHENAVKFGIDKMILNPQLEENFKVQSLFEQYRTEPFMRRRAYRKSI